MQRRCGGANGGRRGNRDGLGNFLLDLWVENRERRARGAIARLDRQLSELLRMRQALARLANSCRAQRPTVDCPLLDAIEPRLEE